MTLLEHFKKLYVKYEYALEVLEDLEDEIDQVWKQMTPEEQAQANAFVTEVIKNGV